MIPIPDAIAIVRVAVVGALAPLCGTFSGRPLCYWLLAEQGAPLPFLVVQSQDGGGDDASFLSLGGWAGLITVKAVAASPHAAEIQLAGVAQAMEGLIAPSGYTIHSTFRRPLVIPPDTSQIHQAGGIYRVQLYRTL